MNKIRISPSQTDATGLLDKDVYEHYYERSITPSARPAKIGPVIKGFDVGVLRAGDIYPSYPRFDLAEGITETIYDFHGYYVRKYEKEGIEGLHRTIFTFHGGSFTMGSMERLNNVYMRLAQLADAVVIAVDYTLSPEAAFPVSAIQCYDAIQKVIERKEEFHCDPDKIITWGDSAGGQLVLNCSLQDRINKIIKMQILYYPVTDLSEYSNEVFDIDRFGTVTDLMLSKIYQTGKAATAEMARAYIQDEHADLKDPMISPLFTEDMSVFPRTVLVTAQYDFLSQQSEELADKLDKAGVKVDHIEFLGNFHGFVERLGFFESSDKSLQMIADLIKKEI